MEKKGRKIDKKAFIKWFLIITTGIIINALCLLIYYLPSSAASSQVGLPYVVDNNNSDYSFNTVKEAYISAYGNNYPSVNELFESDDLLYFFYKSDENSSDIYYDLYLIDTSNTVSLNGIPYDSFDYNTNWVNWNFTGYHIAYTYWKKRNSFYCGAYYARNTFSIGFLGSYLKSPELMLFGEPLFWNMTDQSGAIIVNQDWVPPTISGLAVPPGNLQSPEYEANDTPPTSVPPSYTYNSYTWNTYNPPSVDTSTLESLTESLIDLIGYLGEYLTDNLQQEFSTLYGNLSGFFQYIGKTIQYYGNNIIDSINKGIQNFYDNMKSLVEPIFQSLEELREGFEEFADLFINPFDEEEFEEQIENSSFFTNYNALIDNCEEITEIFDYAEERDHFSLYISFENPFADSEHKIISSEINFDWLVPLRSLYRPFIWVCVLFELFIGGARVLTRILGGHGIG